MSRRVEPQPWVRPDDTERAEALRRGLAEVRSRKPVAPCPCCSFMEHAVGCPLGPVTR